MEKSWYVLRSKPRKELALCNYARSQGYVIFYPSIPVNPGNPRTAKIQPYFHGYIFVNTNLSQVSASTFHWMPFSQGLVHVGGDPICVPDNIINALHRRIEEIWDVGGTAFDGLKNGDQVFIRGGKSRAIERSLTFAYQVRTSSGSIGDAEQSLHAHQD